VNDAAATSLGERPDASGSLARWLRTPPLWFTLVACGVILAARRPEAWRHAQFWAEDGLIFFGQAWSFGWRAVFLPYGGYLHLLPRLVAGLAVQLDPLWTPTGFMLGAAVFTLYVAARTQSARLPFRPHLAYALAVVLVPDVFEVLLLLVNAQCVLAGALVLLLISRDATRPRQHAHDVAAAVLLGLTGPHSVVLAPLFAWRAWRRRSRASVALAAIVGACALVQAWFIVQLPAEPTRPISGEMLLAVPGMRVGASLLAGSFAPLDYPFAVETALGALVLVAVALGAWLPGPARAERVAVALAFALLLAASLYRCRFVLPDLRHATFGNRYFFVVQLCFVWLAIATTLGGPSRRAARLGAVALLWMVAANFSRLREPGLPDLDWPAQAAKLRSGEAVTVPINPAGWSVSVPARPRSAGR
jgi:hypothetical protein